MKVAALSLGIMLWAIVLFADHHNVDFDHHADFSKLKTFALREGKGDSFQPELNNSLVIKKIGDAIRTQLLSKGLMEARNNPDFVVDYSITSEDYVAERGGPVTSSEGTLVIDLVKRDSSALVWRSVYRDSEKNHAKLAQKLPNDVKKSLAEYPPRQKGVIDPGPSTLTVAVPPLTPREAAAAALEIIQTTRTDTAFVGPSVHPGLSINLSGLERAALAVSNDDGRNSAATATRNSALFDAIKSSADYATSIATRNVETPDSRAKAQALATRLRSVLGS